MTLWLNTHRRTTVVQFTGLTATVIWDFPHSEGCCKKTTLTINFSISFAGNRSQAARASPLPLSPGPSSRTRWWVARSRPPLRPRWPPPRRADPADPAARSCRRRRHPPGPPRPPRWRPPSPGSSSSSSRGRPWWPTPGRPRKRQSPPSSLRRQQQQATRPRPPPSPPPPPRS